MTLVYSLRDKLQADPKYVTAVQSRTLDNRALPGGLAGTFGLFASDQWWKSIADGIAPITHLKGTIANVYSEGMHNESRGFEMRTAQGISYKYTCVANRKRDRKRYIAGKKIELIYVTEPLKNPVPAAGDSFLAHTDIVLEISIED